MVGKTATLDDLKANGFWKIFVGTGAGLPTFMNVPGEHLLGVMSANEFLTRVNLMRAIDDKYETPLPDTKGKEVFVIGGGNTAMDAARTARRLGANVTIVYRRTQSEMPARVEELHHALEEGINLKPLRAPSEFIGDEKTHFITHAVLDVNELGPPDKSGRRAPVKTGETERVPVDLVIMALGNTANPIMKDAEPNLKISKWGTIEVEPKSKATSIPDVYSGGDAARGGSTAIMAAGDGQAAARQIVGDIPFDAAEIKAAGREGGALHRAGPGRADRGRQDRAGRRHRRVQGPRADGGALGQGRPVRPRAGLARRRADPADAGGLGRRRRHHRPRHPGHGHLDAAHEQDGDRRRVRRHRRPARPGQRAAPLRARPDGGVHRRRRRPAAGLPDRAGHLELGNHVTLIAGFRSKDFLFWTGEDERVGKLKAKYGDQLDVIYATNDGTFGIKGFVTTPLEEMLKNDKTSKGRKIAEVITIGPPIMMRVVSDLTRPYGVKTVASLNSIMVDATGMCGACMVPVTIDGKLVRKHACIDGPEIDAHIIDWDKFLPRFGTFKTQEQRSKEAHGLA